MSQSMVASQLEEVFNTEVERNLQRSLIRIPRGCPASLDPAVEVLVAAPWLFAGQEAERDKSAPPHGWPWGLKWIQLLTSGVDAYPKWFLNTLPVATARGVAAEPIAEYVLGAILCATKRFPETWIDGPHAWQPKWLDCVSESTVGIIGFGPIGRAIASKALALGARVMILRRSGRSIDLPGVIQANDLKTLAESVDHLVLAAPITAETTNMVDSTFFRYAKPGMHLINISRGELIDDAAVIAALSSGQLSLATLDVARIEPLPEGHPFYSNPKVRISPHTSGVSRVTRIALARKFMENLKRFEGGQPLLDQLEI